METIIGFRLRLPLFMGLRRCFYPVAARTGQRVRD